MNEDFRNQTFEEKVAKVKAAPEIAAELLENQFSLMESMKQQIEIQTQFEYVDDQVTAKKAVNLRSLPSTEDPRCKIVAQLDNGVVIRRTGINRDLGWSRVDYNGQPLYCITSYLKVVG